MNIVILGFMGAGKTVVGTHLASRLGYQFLDTDQQIEKDQGCTIIQIFKYVGESFFRKLESDLLVQIQHLNNTVISTGAGILTTEGNLELIHDIGTTVYLEVDVNEIFHRVKRKKSRPLLQTDNPKKTIKELLEKRRHFYEKAQLKITTKGLNLYRIASTIMALLHKDILE